MNSPFLQSPFPLIFDSQTSHGNMESDLSHFTNLFGHHEAPTTTRSRPKCPNCTRPQTVCLCTTLPPLPPTTTKLIIIQHPHQLNNPLSTIPILTQTLPSSTTTIISRRLYLGLSPLLDSHYHSPLPPPSTLYLFPPTHSHHSLPLSQLYNTCPDNKIVSFEGINRKFEENVDSNTCPRNKIGNFEEKTGDFEGRCDFERVLIVFDGTWKHAKEMVNASIGFLSKFAIRVCLDVDESEEGGCIFDEAGLILRKEPYKGCVSTAEAVARAMRVLEPNGVEIEERLLGVLREMVRSQKSFLRKEVKFRPKLLRKGKRKEEEKEDQRH